jgi:hypothetical protein
VAANTLPQDAKNFRALVKQAIPVGTSIQVAKTRVEALGLTCTWVTRGWTNNIHDQTEFYFCDRQAGSIVLTRWQVSLLPKQEKVVSVRANVGLVGP